MSSKVLLVASLMAVLFALSGCPSPDGGDDAGVDGAPAPAPVGTSVPATPDEDEIDYKCPVCGMDSSKSPAMVQSPEGIFDSLVDWAKHTSERKLEIKAVLMVDYPTAEGERIMIPVEGAFFVEVDSLRMTMPPFIVAFVSEDEASKFAVERDGEMMSHEAVVERLQSEIESAEDGHEQ